jgi:hypothetical protein
MSDFAFNIQITPGPTTTIDATAKACVGNDTSKACVAGGFKTGSGSTPSSKTAISGWSAGVSYAYRSNPLELNGNGIINSPSLGFKVGVQVGASTTTKKDREDIDRFFVLNPNKKPCMIVKSGETGKVSVFGGEASLPPKGEKEKSYKFQVKETPKGKQLTVANEKGDTEMYPESSCLASNE